MSGTGEGGAPTATIGHPAGDPARAGGARPTGATVAAGAGACLAGAAVIGVAFNLRPALAGFSPLTGDVGGSLDLGAGVLALVTTLPLVCFAVFGPAAAPLAARFGPERVLVGTLILLAGGLLARTAGGTAALVVGAVLVGVAIAVANVLLPGMVKRRFPHNVGLLTAVYAGVIGAGAAVAAGAAQPLMAVFGGWRGSLAFWALPALVAAAILIPLARGVGAAPGAPAEPPTSLATSPGWPVTAALAAFFGLNSMVFYVELAWLPEVLVGRGSSPGEAGLMLAAVQIVGLPLGFVVTAMARTPKAQGRWAAAASAASALGFAGMLLAPDLPPHLWIVLFACGVPAFPLSLAMVAMRADGPAQADRLSGFVQSIGYLLAAAGPLAVGALYDLTGGWAAAMAGMTLVATVMTPVAWLCGYERNESPPPGTSVKA
ncbi:MFS transporter [Rhizohabitans arisaemae]|uniref:MFS transporter n=1 Tax=Rhizohabitans arisaemae TaxID=2720610 RepID=UPI0024B1F061|nr:MFS transporter [Rhizohabitans arisaemae]